MKTIMPQKNFIFVIVLITALVIFGMGVLFISAEDEGQAEPTPDVIVTGDAEVVVEGENIVNSNIVDPPLDEPLEDPLENPLDESLCEENCGEEPTPPPCGETCETEELVIDNEAEVENDLEAGGFTGDNEIETENEGDAVIQTGNVNIYVGLINTVNSNIINSTLSEILYNIFNQAQGDIDIPDEVVENSQGCGETECENIVTDNEGSIDNDILVEGSSGDNSIETENGDAIIQTGDINMVTNIFNVINSNILGSNWVRLIINIFGDWTGDLVLPGQQAMQNFTENSSSVCGAGCDADNVVVDNEGEIENNVQVNANTGENSAEGNDSTINTGTANVETNVLNVVNSNITHNNWFFMAINNFGNWQGQVFSLPQGFNLSQDLNGIKIFNSGENKENEENSNGNALNLVKDNSGSIENGVIINVDTGNNSANSENGAAYVGTGNANAVTNLVNVLNSNVSGSNWLLGMINIFGSWQGDVAFGRPDLWIGESAVTSPNPAKRGGSITYTLTYLNNGDADATSVILIDDFDEKYLNVTDAGGGIVVDNPGEIQWDLGTIPAGGSGSVSYSVGITREMPDSPTIYLINQSAIDSFEDDNNNEDNIDSLSIEVPEKTLVYVSPSTPELQITKTANVSDFVYSGSTVDYTITITNLTNGVAYDVVVNDVLRNGGVINNYSWYLGTVYGKEAITINYTIAIGEEIPAGFYTNTAHAIGVDAYGSPVVSSEGSATIEVRAGEGATGVVEGTASTSEEFEESSYAPEGASEGEQETGGNVGIGEEVGIVEVEEETEEIEEPEVLGAKTSGLKFGILQYSQFEFDDWIYIVLLSILVSAAVLFLVLYLLDYSHEFHNL